MRPVGVKNASGRVYNRVGSELKMRRVAFLTASGRVFNANGLHFRRRCIRRSQCS